MTEDGILLDYAEHGDPLFSLCPDCDADKRASTTVRLPSHSMILTTMAGMAPKWTFTLASVLGHLYAGRWIDQRLESRCQSIKARIVLDWYSGDYDDEISFELEDQNGNVFYKGVFGDAVNEVARTMVRMTTTLRLHFGSCTQLFDATGAYLTLADCQAAIVTTEAATCNMPLTRDATILCFC